MAPKQEDGKGQAAPKPVRCWEPGPSEGGLAGLPGGPRPAAAPAPVQAGWRTAAGGVLATNCHPALSASFCRAQARRGCRLGCPRAAPAAGRRAKWSSRRRRRARQVPPHRPSTPGMHGDCAVQQREPCPLVCATLLVGGCREL